MQLGQVAIYTDSDGLVEPKTMSEVSIRSQDFENEGGSVQNEDPDAVPTHPLQIKPSGNAAFAVSNLRFAVGLFQVLPDELIHLILEYLDQQSLLQFGQTCKAFYAFSRSEELWKQIFIR